MSERDLFATAQLTDDPKAAADAFWRFSLALYAQRGVAATCLELQDDWGCDVPMALLCVFAGLVRGELAGETIEAASARNGRWSELAIEPLRGSRRRLKAALAEDPDALPPEAAAYRERVKELELKAEEASLRMLSRFALTATAPGGAAAADANFRRYMATLGRDAPPPATPAWVDPWTRLRDAAVDLGR